MDKTHPLAEHIDRSVLLLLLSSCQIHVPSTMRLCNSRIPEECLVCHQMSQRNWVIIKMLYRYLRRCLLSWHRSRLGFATPSIGEVSLGPLDNTHPLLQDAANATLGSETLRRNFVRCNNRKRWCNKTVKKGAKRLRWRSHQTQFRF